VLLEARSGSPMAEVPNLLIPTESGEIAHARAIAKRYGSEYIDLKDFPIRQDVMRSVPADMMFRYNFVPLEQHNGRLMIAVADPSRLMMLDEIADLLHKHLTLRVATLSQITDLLKKTEQSQRVLDEATKGLAPEALSTDRNSEENISVEILTSDKDSDPIVRLVDTIIFTALDRRASDIHFETYDHDMHVRYRIDGVLHPAIAPISLEHGSTILSRIKVMSELDITERRVPQDGRFGIQYNDRLIDIRVSIMPTVHGENAVLRILDKESMSKKFGKLTLDVIGFSDDDLKRFRRYIVEPYGMVLVTGPTGSGKTTTLYAALNEVNSDEDKIITIEDPVEYEIIGVTQIPVNEKKGLTFARGLRSILRHDPDKIMVGEIRDNETAQIAIQSALTGHLVFTTVHANNVIDVLGRFLNMGVEAYNFVSAINCILAQRLVRTICEHCVRTVKYDNKKLTSGGLEPIQEWQDFPFSEGAGCLECNGTGYRGRTAIHELLDMTDPIRKIILEKKSSSEIRELAKQEGMHFLRESALDRVRRGLTTLREINKVTFIEASR
jgi:type II secretory ATPase GspE/PulE/Tfp pilus assembly ATPase PilB-like protein